MGPARQKVASLVLLKRTRLAADDHAGVALAESELRANSPNLLWFEKAFNKHLEQALQP
jgi:hypothetical protein